MKLIVKDINYISNVFYGVLGNRKIGFYLSNKLATIFINNIAKGYLVDFEISDQTKIIDGYTCYQVNHFNLIKNIRTNKDYYNHKSLQVEMIDFLKNQENILFLDLEMTIAGYGQKNYQPQIVQYGYVLINESGGVIKSGDNYLLPKEENYINKRTFWFLKIERRNFYEQAKDYLTFYNELKYIIKTYQPKIVVWGKNDIKTLSYSYELHNVDELTQDNDFIDLLRLHRNFYNLKNDLGLFNAYKEYYAKEADQRHHAKDDAKITQKVYEAFLEYGSKMIEK